MYYYKSKIETFENGKVVVRFEQKRSSEKRIYIVDPKSVGGLSRTHKIIRLVNANDRAQTNAMNYAFKAIRSETQANERKAKRIKQPLKYTL